MEEIRQNGKIILYSDDGTSIRMIFKNLTGRNFQGQEYAEYIRHIAIGHRKKVGRLSPPPLKNGCRVPLPS